MIEAKEKKHALNIKRKTELKDIKELENIMEKKARSFWEDFRGFAFKGNMIDLAIGLIIGTAFNNLVQSLVKDIVMPPIGKLLGNVNFSNLYINLANIDYPTLADAEAAGAPVIKYGQFLTNVIDFVILTLTIYIVLKVIFRYKVEEKKDKQ